MVQIYATMSRVTALVIGSLLVPTAAAQGFVPCMPYGGDQAVRGLLDQELRFPAAELEQGLRGSSVLIWRSLTPACDAEALRIGGLVRWHPATVGGLPHAAEHYLEVPFDAKRYLRHMGTRHCPGDHGT